MSREQLTVSELTEFVAETVEAFIDKEKSFTAYDVTKAVRDAHSNKNVPHNPVRGIVHGLFEADEMRDYVRYPDVSIKGMPLRYESPLQSQVPVVTDDSETDDAKADAAVKVGPVG